MRANPTSKNFGAGTSGASGSGSGSRRGSKILAFPNSFLELGANSPCASPSDNWSTESSTNGDEDQNAIIESAIDYSIRAAAGSSSNRQQQIEQHNKQLRQLQQERQQQKSSEQSSSHQNGEADNGQDKEEETDNFPLANVSGSQPTVAFTSEETQLIEYVRKSRAHIVGKISNAYYDEMYREELTAVLVSRGSIKPSFQFLEKMNKSIMETSMEVINDILDLFNMSEASRRVLLSENVSFACLVGAAVYTYGNKAKTFVEQAKLSGIPTMYVKWLEDNNLADIVPRLEISYLNPSPWAEKEVYEIEFNEVLKKVSSTLLKEESIRFSSDLFVTFS